MSVMEIHFIDPSIEKFIRSLEKSAIAKVLRTLDLLERFGYQLGMPHGKKVADGLFELRVRGTQDIRFLYTFHGRRIVILHGFVKKSDRIPQREMEMALQKKKRLDRV